MPLYMAKVVNRSPGTAAAVAVLAPSNIPLSLMAECEQLSTVLADAYCNPSRSTSIVYSFRSLIGYLFKLMCHGLLGEYNDLLPPRPNGFNGPVEDQMECMFPPLFATPYPVVQTPCSLSDASMAILYCICLMR